MGAVGPMRMWTCGGGHKKEEEEEEEWEEEGQVHKEKTVRAKVVARLEKENADKAGKAASF